jgi:hypothetical protein
MAIVQKITLVDRGQDFTEWYVRDTVVIDCQPFSGAMWVGTQIELPEGPLKVGSTLHIRTPIKKWETTTLNYPVEAIEVLSDVEAAEVEDIGRRWAGLRGIAASEWGL